MIEMDYEAGRDEVMARYEEMIANGQENKLSDFDKQAIAIFKWQDRMIDAWLRAAVEWDRNGRQGAIKGKTVQYSETEQDEFLKGLEKDGYYLLKNEDNQWIYLVLKQGTGLAEDRIVATGKLAYSPKGKGG
jgi:hypothetical protein